MSSAAAAPAGPDLGSKALRMIGVTALFLALGPLIGGVVVIVGFGSWIGLSTSSPGDIPALILAMMIYGLWIAYVMGAVPALLTGLVIGFMDAFRSGASFAFVLALGGATGVGWSMMAFADVIGSVEPKRIVLPILTTLACVIATVVCWLATRWKARA